MPPSRRSNTPTPGGSGSTVLAAAVVHEVRRLLTPARGYAELALRQPGLPSEVCQSLQAIISASVQCEAIMDCLVEFRTEGSCDIGEVIGYHFGKDSSVVVECDESCEVPLAAAAIECIVSNLVANAKRASKGDQGIRISGRRSTGNICSIEVRDQGVGMTPSQAAGAVLPFVSHSASAGMGLAICKAIVESVGGTISIRSQVGHGTAVTVTLPSVQTAKKAA